MAEGQQGIASFDVMSYKRQYADLRQAYGNDLPKYYWHYMNYGYKENRAGTGCTVVYGPTTKYNGVDYSKVYNYYYYVDRYPEVEAEYGEDDAAILEHFVLHGMAEGHQGIASFDVISYKLRYPELRELYGNNLTEYYLDYIDSGYISGRSGQYCDEVVGATTIYEGVDYSNVYNYYYYVSVNPDIKNAYGNDDEAVLKHFVLYGRSECRRAIDSFDVIAYRSRYYDLQNAYGDDWIKYYNHYMYYGYYEGRIGA